MFSALCFASVLFSAHAREFLGEEYSKLPNLFHLDNYDECLSKPGGLYCLGTFDLVPKDEPNPTYHLMTEYSKETYAFNRTLIHRGYCVSTRCPHPGNETWIRNTTIRMEKCTDKMSNIYNMHAELHTLHYCRTYEEAESKLDPDLFQIIYLVVIAFILSLNISGTVYDMMTGDNPKKINFLLCWSIRSNWKELTECSNKSVNMSLEAIQGIRVAVTVSICFVHGLFFYYIIYQYNPRVLEQITGHPLTMLIQNSTAVEQMFVVLSSFFCVYSLRRTSDNKTFSIRLLVKLIAKRIFRISPLYLLVIGFMATWWPYLNDGPMWRAMAVTESNICRDKFLYHALFVNNLVEPEKYCVLPTWYIAVDIQLYIIALIVTFLLAPLKRGRLTILIILLAASTVLNAVLVYIFDWKPLVYVFTVTEEIRTLFRDSPSFIWLYMSLWGNLPACLVGLIMGHLYPAMVASNFDIAKYKWILNIAYSLSIPVLSVWLLMGNAIQHIRNSSFIAVYAAAERSVFQILCLLIYVLLNLVGSFIIKLFAWRGWQAVARLSFSVTLLHWCVNMMLVLPSPQPLPTSVINVLMVGAGTTCFTFILALPMTLLVEFPMARFFQVLSSL